MYSSHELPIVITPTEDADDVYREYLGSELFGLPVGGEERLKKWPGLKASEEQNVTMDNYNLEIVEDSVYLGTASSDASRCS